jgi:hypothetical protein
MELMATDAGPRYMAPLLTPHERFRLPIDGFAVRLIVTDPAVPSHDAAANPPLSARIDLLL